MSKYDTMEAGLELDRLVAERIFGLVVTDDKTNFRGVSVGRYGYDGRDLPFYSTEIADAWRVVNPLVTSGYRFGVCEELAFGEWQAHFGTTLAIAEKAPLAICRAALKARARDTEPTS